MKKIANRVLALIVALTILLMPAAMAAEQNTAVLSIGNFEISVGEMSLSLPVTLQLGAGADIAGERGMAIAQLLVGEQSAGAVYGALEDNQIKIYVNGMDYGLYLPLEEVMAMLEAEMGTAMSDLSTAIPSELETALTELMAAAAALESVEVSDETVYAALNVTMTEAGTADIEVFGETSSAAKTTFVAAPQTLQAAMDSLSAAIPAFADYWSSYSAVLTQIMAQSGEEVNLEELFGMITIAAEGAFYTTEADTIVEITLSMTVEGETIELPCIIAAHETDDVTAADFSMNMTIDSEELYVFTSTYETAETFNLSFGMGVTDVETNETEGSFLVSLDSSDTADGVSFGFGLTANDGYEDVSLDIDYIGTHAQTSGDITSWDGVFALIASAEGMEINAAMDTNLTLSVMADGELLSLGENSINLLEMTDEQMDQFANDAQVPLMQLLGTLMQDESIAALMGSLMG